MKLILFVILYFIIAGITAFCWMAYDRIKHGSYDTDVCYFGAGLMWPVLFPALFIWWIGKQFKKLAVLVIELLILWRDKDGQ